MSPITFITDDFKASILVQDDLVVIILEIANCTVKKTLVDQGSWTDILFWNSFKQMDIPQVQNPPT